MVITICVLTSSVWGPFFPHRLAPEPLALPVISCLRPLGPATKCFLLVLPLPGASVKVFLLLGSSVDSLQHWSCRHILQPPWVTLPGPGPAWPPSLPPPGILLGDRAHRHPDLPPGIPGQASWWALGVFEKPALAQFTEYCLRYWMGCFFFFC